MSGFDQDRFANPNELFTCCICTQISNQPQECTECGTVFCKICIQDWLSKKKECVNRCKGDAIKKLNPSLLQIYNEMKIRCQHCKQLVSLEKLDNHEQDCSKPKCINFAVCNNIVGDQFSQNNVCDDICQLINQMNGEYQNKKYIYGLVKEYIAKYTQDDSFDKQLKINQPVIDQQSKVVIDQVVNQVVNFKWVNKPPKIGSGVSVLDADCKHVYLSENHYLYKSVVADQPFMSGIHYWEIKIDHRTENELKIGVTTTIDFVFDSAFCDTNSGFAYYGLGQLRNGSNAQGNAYGERFKNSGEVGVYLNMNKGILVFSLNGKVFETAYTDDKLKKGPIYASVALLHQAGCILKSGLPIPKGFDKFK